MAGSRYNRSSTTISSGRSLYVYVGVRSRFDGNKLFENVVLFSFLITFSELLTVYIDYNRLISLPLFLYIYND